MRGSRSIKIKTLATKINNVQTAFSRIESATTTVTVASLTTGTKTNKSSVKRIRNLPGYVNGDQAGHVIGNQLGGPGGQNFVFPIRTKPNAAMREIENDIAAIAGSGKTVNVTVKLNFKNAGTASPWKIEIFYNYTNSKGTPVSAYAPIFNR